MPSHPKTTKHRKTKREGSKRILAGFLLIAIVVLFIGSLVKVINAWQARLWQGDERFTILVVTPTLSIISYQGQTGELTKIAVPQDLELSSAGNLGRWKAGSLYSLGKQKTQSGEILRLTLQNTLGVPINAWSESSNFLIPSVSSNLNFFDRVRIALAFSRVPAAKTDQLSLVEEGIIERTALPSGELGYILKQKDNLSPLEQLTDISIAKEGIGVGVINSTKNTGLGKRVARLINGMGAPVLWVKTEGSLTLRCTLHVDSKFSKSQTIKSLAKILACENKYEVMDEGTFSTPVELILGEGIAPDFPAL